MKRIYLVVLLCSFVFSSSGQQKYKGLTVIKAKSSKASFRTNGEWMKDSWTISPQIQYDTLLIACHDKEVDFGFYTDSDSAVYKLMPDDIHSFYVLLGDSAYAMTIIKAYKPAYNAIQHDEASKNEKITFFYEQNNNNEYLNRLRNLYPIDSLISDTKNDMQKVLNILSWVHHQWQHDGMNEPKKSDAISILEEVKEGKNFRCVEYGIVVSACLNSIGLKSRTLALKTKDVATTQYGAGHVLTEVYLNDIKKWVLIDGQWDAMPVLNNTPLNAVEFQHAIASDYKNLEIKTSTGTSKSNYTSWIYPYLYFFDAPFDNREGKTGGRKKINGKSSLMLVPLGALNPTVFQINGKIDYCLYTNSIKDFYAPPNK